MAEEENDYSKIFKATARKYQKTIKITIPKPEAELNQIDDGDFITCKILHIRKKDLKRK